MTVHVIGGGIAGCEAAYQLAERGISVVLYEMRPKMQYGAHQSGLLAEIVALQGGVSYFDDPFNPYLQTPLQRQLSHELIMHQSKMMTLIQTYRLNENKGFCYDVKRVTHAMHQAIITHPCITIKRVRLTQLPPGPTILATGPNTDVSLLDHVGVCYEKQSQPEIVVDVQCDFVALDDKQLQRLITFLRCAQCVPRLPHEKDIDTTHTLEHYAHQGAESFIEHVLIKHKTGYVWPIRSNGALQNSCTRLVWSKQRAMMKIIFPMKPVVIRRYGVVHRNTYLLEVGPHLNLLNREDCFAVGQIAGIDGYLEAIASGFYVGATMPVAGKDNRTGLYTNTLIETCIKNRVEAKLASLPYNWR
ncbi:FAD-dependent oxidoreductase [Erysipelothrix tonsillarum]|uniref:FAD-dependent oxidoreductase n=1 Tax=Erysipelothrix tonsillarum TaxID=38402 RepID=UPI00037C438D|nr:FAD-dependent oxidoreductase [Erysipelothrix tonsillarum]